MKKSLLAGILAIFLSNPVNAQVYVEKQTRHRFAQMTLGADYQMGFGGETQFLNANNQIENLAFPNTGNPRILIGGTHFWGHADFQISIPVGSKTFKSQNQEITAESGVETSLKYFPWRIEHNKVRPYIGTAVTPFYYKQNNNNLEYGNGSERGRTAVPLMAGVTFNNKNHLVELGVTWDYQNKQNYYISQKQVASVTTPPVYAHLSYRYMLDTTLEAEEDWESGRTAKITKKLGDAGKLDGFFLGVGMSSAWWLDASSYNTSNRPYIPKYNTAIMPDFTVGYYLHNPDVNISLTYRGYNTSTRVYGTAQDLGRKSFGIEATKYIGDYHGFTPFVGPVLTTERLNFREGEMGNLTQNLTNNQLAYGLTFGWDIRPNRLQWFLLRTNLRWFPNLEVKVNEAEAISFRNIEFNFIQLIVFPNRILGKR
jgi:hypothetical protein